MCAGMRIDIRIERVLKACAHAYVQGMRAGQGPEGGRSGLARLRKHAKSRTQLKAYGVELAERIAAPAPAIHCDSEVEWAAEAAKVH